MTFLHEDQSYIIIHSVFYYTVSQNNVAQICKTLNATYTVQTTALLHQISKGAHLHLFLSLSFCG